MARNVVLVVLDSVRKDYFDEHAPRLADAADVSFEHCRAASNWSPSSHGAIFTGELPHVSGLHSHDPSYDDIPIEDTLFDAFRDHYRFAVSSNLFVARPYGFDEYFDEFTSVSRHAVFAEGEEIDSFLHDVDADGVRRYYEFLRQALGHDETVRSIANGLMLKTNDYLEGVPVPRLWDYGTRTQLSHAADLATAGREPFFGFINLMETHNPHANNVFYRAEDVPNDWWSDKHRTVPFNNRLLEDPDGYDDHVQHYRDTYAASIDYVDRKLVPFVERLRRETEEETTVVVTADHGENLCYPDDDGMLGHIGNVTESLLHVPLLVFNAPESVREPDDTYFSHLDLRTLLAGLADDELPTTYRDRVPAEVVGGAPPDHVENYDYWDRMIRAVYDGDRKYVWDSFGERSVYRVDRDRPCRQEEVDEPFDESVEELFEVPLAEFKSRFGDAQEKDWGDDIPEDRLKRLGYL
ncbi:sulfatase-like hydrolase/transferase [Halosimplex halophilum]|uniref:sulfatase-like hydrolase/transferase n=1 Tax=Halosimplex halophilum TaxID=2559572 RepID=UPI00107EF119|nr:sulfatase-like hydrolase/transferase [Halosimplex halophilum]